MEDIQQTLEVVLAQARTQAEVLAVKVNASLAEFSPLELIVLTLAATIVISKLLSWIRYVRLEGIQVILFRFATKLPFMTNFVNKEKDKFILETKTKYQKQRQGKTIKTLPMEPWSDKKLMSVLEPHAKDASMCYQNGSKISGTVYISDEKHWDMMNKVSNMFSITNALHMDEWPQIVTMQAEIIRMVANMYHGDENSCGIVTSGGTESIILALLAYREKGKSQGISNPNVVMPSTAHAAFDKACFYFNIEIRKIALTKDHKADVKALKRACDSNTVAMVASCPEFPYGNFDPLPEIAAFCKKRGIGCHADCCLGSFCNAFAKDAGFKLPYEPGFNIDGVTSISCDPHKYAFSPKGLSVCLFKDSELRSYQFFATLKWNGGYYTTINIAGSRPGAVIASTWACLMRIGKKGYIENTRLIMQAAQDTRKAIEKEVPEVKLGSTHESAIVSLLTRTELDRPINCIALSDVMKSEKNWILNTVQNPGGLHIAYTLCTAPLWREFIADLKYCIKLMRMKPELNHNSSVASYGTTASIPDGNFLGELAKMHSACILDIL